MSGVAALLLMYLNEEVSCVVLFQFDLAKVNHHCVKASFYDKLMYQYSVHCMYIVYSSECK